MSTNYDVHCIDCNEDHWASMDSTPPNRNHVVEGIVAIAPQLAALALAIEGSAALYDPELSICYHYLNLEWFAKHSGHWLICADEYGDWRKHGMLSKGNGLFYDPVSGKAFDMRQAYEGEGDADAVLYQAFVQPLVDVGHTEECATCMGFRGTECSCGRASRP